MFSKFPVTTENGRYKVTVIDGHWGTDVKIYQLGRVLFIPVFRKVRTDKYTPNVLRGSFNYSIKDLATFVVKEYERDCAIELDRSIARRAGVKEFEGWDGVIRRDADTISKTQEEEKED